MDPFLIVIYLLLAASVLMPVYALIQHIRTGKVGGMTDPSRKANWDHLNFQPGELEVNTTGSPMIPGGAVDVQGMEYGASPDVFYQD